MAKILLVEDDTNLSEIYQARMEAEGYTVVSASDGEAALAVAAKEKPDLIISDVMMPKISGFEMLDILRNTAGLKNTPVIMLTALGQADDKTRADQLGADRYLVKSQVTLEDIVNAAHALLSDDGGRAAAADNSSASSSSSDAADSTPAAPVSTPVVAAPAPTPDPAPAVQPIAVATPPSEPTVNVNPTPVVETPVAAPAEKPTEPAPSPAPVTITPAPAEPAAELGHSEVVNLQAPAPAATPAPGGPGATISPSTPPTPAPHETAAPLDGAVIDDGAVNNAVNNLLSQQNDATTVAGQRVITPPTQTAKPSLDELLAREEQRENGGQPGGTVTPQGGGVDPNSIAL